MISSYPVHGQLGPLLWARVRREHHGGRAQEGSCLLHSRQEADESEKKGMRAKYSSQGHRLVAPAPTRPHSWVYITS